MIYSIIAKNVFLRAIAFVGTAVFSVALMNSLPRIREQRQRSFARATMGGNLYRMQWLHFAGAKINTRGNGCMPLYLAASEGRLDVVRYLLDEGADVNAREKLGYTPLAEAAFNGHLAVVNELLLRGAEINVIGDDGTALDLATSRNNTAVADLLKHRGGKTAREIHAGS